MRLIDADAMAESIEHDVELDARALDSTDLVGPEREHVQFDKDCKQNCMWYLTEQPTVHAPRWVRCEEDKPKERDYYFAFTADAEAFVGEYIPSVDQWWKDDYLILTVTHWMPIEPPKEDE